MSKKTPSTQNKSTRSSNLPAAATASSPLLKSYLDTVSSCAEYREDSKKAVTAQLKNSQTALKIRDTYASAMAKELQRDDLSPERRNEILEDLKDNAERADSIERENREFVQEEQARSFGTLLVPVIFLIVSLAGAIMNSLSSLKKEPGRA